MQPDALIAAIRADGAAMAAAARLGLGAEVPSCPGWSVETIVNHMGRIHRWAAGALRGGDNPPFPPRPDEVTPEWLEEGVAELCGTLQAADPMADAWNFLGVDRRALFWFRRQAVETAIHRWDTEYAHDVRTPIDAGVATTGIDEALTVFLGRAVSRAPDSGIGGTLHLHATDAHLSDGGEWLVSIEGGAATVTREHDKGDFAVRGRSSDLLLLLWGRLAVDAESFETFGDSTVFERWRDMKVVG